MQTLISILLVLFGFLLGLSVAIAVLTFLIYACWNWALVPLFGLPFCSPLAATGLALGVVLIRYIIQRTGNANNN